MADWKDIIMHYKRDSHNTEVMSTTRHWTQQLDTTNQAGHSISDMRINIIEKVYSRDPQMREIRESHYINEMNTFHRGMNRRK